MYSQEVKDGRIDSNKAKNIFKILKHRDGSKIDSYKLVYRSVDNDYFNFTRFGLLSSFYLKLIISNEEMNDIMKIVQAPEDSNIFLKGVSKTIKNETKEQGVFLGMLLGTLWASLLGDTAGKGIVRVDSGKRIVTAGYGNKLDF